MILKNKYLHLFLILVFLVIFVFTLNYVSVETKKKTLVSEFHNQVEYLLNKDVDVDDLYYKTNIIKLVYKDKNIVSSPTKYPILFYYDVSNYNQNEINYYIGYFMFYKEVTQEYEILYMKRITFDDFQTTNVLYTSSFFSLIFFVIVCCLYFHLDIEKKNVCIKMSKALSKTYVSTKDEYLNSFYKEISDNNDFVQLSKEFLSLSEDALVLFDVNKEIIYYNKLSEIFIVDNKIENELIHKAIDNCFNNIFVNEHIEFAERHFNILTLKRKVRDKIYCAIYLTNITEKVNYEKNKLSFFHQASHELRTPLSVLFGFSSMLAEDDLSSIDMKKMIKYNMEECRKLDVLINSIIDISQRFKMDDFFSKVSVDDLIDKVLKKYSRFSKYEIIKKYDKKTYLLCNDIKMEVLIDIIMKNAFVHNLDTGFVDVTLTNDCGLITLYVKNSSVNLLKEEKSRVFDPFYKCPSNLDDHQKGTGLGLSLAKIICDNYNYKISFENNNYESTIKIKFNVSTNE